MADLNEEVTLSNGKKITISKLIHDYALLIRFVSIVAQGSTADRRAVHEPGYKPGPYVNRRTFQRQTQQEAEALLKELGIL